MKISTLSKKKSIFLCFLIMAFLSVTAHADILDYNFRLDITPTNGGYRIDRKVSARELQNTEIIRGSDITRRVRDLMQRTRDFIAMMRGRQRDQAQSVKLNQITNANTRDIIIRNKMAMQSQKQMIREQVRKNRDLTRRIRDMSR